MIIKKDENSATGRKGKMYSKLSWKIKIESVTDMGAENEI